MKKLILFSILFFGIFPLIQKGKIVLMHTTQIHAQDAGEGDPNEDFGEDDPNNCNNCRISDTNFDDYLDHMATDCKLTISDPRDGVWQQSDGTTYTGQYTDIKDADGTTVYQYFSPDASSGPFTYGLEYSTMGDPGQLDSSSDGSGSTSTGGGDSSTGGDGSTDGGSSSTGGDGSGGGDAVGGDSSSSGYTDVYPPAELDPDLTGGTAIYTSPGTPLTLAFRFLNAGIVGASITARMQTPTRIDQNGTGLCGMACIAKTLAQLDPNGYSSLVNNLLLNGFGTYAKTGYTVDVRGSDILTANPSDSTWPVNSYAPNAPMNQADFVLLASLKVQTNNIPYSYGPHWYQQITGATGPSTMQSLMTNFLGLQFVANNTTLSALNFTQYTRQDLEREVTAQQTSYSQRIVYMFIDDDMINSPNGLALSILPNHWVELLPNTYSYDATTRTLTFRVFSWGGTVPITIGEDNFNRYFYGTVAGNK